ncbi:MAG TPA: hypothetical protein VMD31_02405 [Opitutaceae bacterium]|nr:hypothetical protein [Opitutaceae bacterium]
MSLLSSLGFSGVATKKVVLLPDHAFFMRVAPLTPGTEPADVPAQVELALEGMSPFPVAHLCYGYFHRPGSGRVLIYAAYRRRFTVDDAAEWAAAEAVLPAFVAWLGLPPAGARALLVHGADFVTALGWDGHDPVPAVVAARQLAPDAAPEERAAAEAALTAQLAGLPAPVGVPAATGTVSRVGDDGLAFAADGCVAHFAVAELDALDVRDKAELAARRRERTRNLYLWRAFQTGLGALGLAVALEVALAGAGLWERARAAQAAAQAPAVQAIETKNSLASRIEELSTNRLLPLEMISLAGSKLKGSNIQFLRTSTKGLYTLEIEGQTNSTPDVNNYQAALKELPACDHVELGQTSDRGGITRFVLTITFKPGAVQPAANPS